MKFTADQARKLCGARTLEQKIDEILDAIKNRASQGFSSIQTGNRFEYDKDPDLWNSGYESPDWVRATEKLKELGFNIDYCQYDFSNNSQTIIRW